MGRSRSQTSHPSWSGPVAAAVTLLLSVALTLTPARKTAAQAGDTHIVVSEVLYDLDGTDRAREYVEFANLGTKDWDPHNCWIYRWDTDETGAARDPVMLQITGDGAKELKPIPPGSALLVEWGRPNPDNGDYPTASGPNVFQTGRSAGGAAGLQDNDLQDRMVIALFDAQASAPATPDTDATFGGATMLAYYIQGNINEGNG